MSKIVKLFKNPYRIFLFLAQKNKLNNIKDERYLKLIYRAIMNRKLNLTNPKTFNEKIQWLKLYDRNPLYTTLVDKYEVKKYIANELGVEYIIPNIGVWNSFDEIDFDSLPDKFVLKCTHDSGTVVICKDKQSFNFEAAKQKLSQRMKYNYYYNFREWPYKDVSPRIIAENFLTDEESNNKGLTDYKFFCFNGEPKFLYVSTGLEDHKTAHISFLSLDWEFTSFQRSDYAPLETLPKKPSKLDEMLKISKTLAKDFPFVRVDLYQINNRVYFSELTFHPCGGMTPFKKAEDDKAIGDMLILPIKKTEK